MRIAKGKGYDPRKFRSHRRLSQRVQRVAFGCSQQQELERFDKRPLTRKVVVPRVRIRTVDRCHEQLGDVTVAWCQNPDPGALSGYVVAQGIYHLLSLRRREDVRRCLYEPHFLSEFLGTWPDVFEPLRAARVAGLEALVGHYESLLEVDGGQQADQLELEVLDIIGDFIDECGEPEIAYKIAALVCSRASEEGGVSQDELAVYGQTLAVRAAQTLRLDEAENIYRYNLAFQQKAYGHASEEACATIFNLASLSDRRGDYRQSLEGYRSALELSTEVHGPLHDMTVTAAAKLAEVLIEIERIDEAAHYLEEARGWSRALGSDTGIAAEMLSRIQIRLCKAQGRQDHAIGCAIDLVSLQANLRGRSHPQTLDDISTLGMLYKNSRRYAEAEPLLREASEGLVRLGVAGHQNSITARTGLALLLLETGRPEEALNLMGSVVDDARSMFGRFHHRFATTLLTAGVANLHADDAGRACGYFEEAVSIYSSSLGENGGLVSTARHFWSKALYEAGHYDQAVEQLLIVDSGESAEACEGGPVSALIHWDLARCYRKLGRPDDAARHREVCWKLECDTEGAGSSAALQTSYALARDFLEAGREVQARDTLDAALAFAAADHEEDGDRAEGVAKLRQLRSSI